MPDSDCHRCPAYILALIVIAIVVAPISVVTVVIIFVAKSQIRVLGYTKAKTPALRSHQVT
jgi:hypothetical protein